MNTTLRMAGKHVIVEINDNISIYNVQELKKTLFDLIEDPQNSSLVVDLGNISFIDSSLISTLVAGLKKMKARGGEFSLLHLHNSVVNILTISNLLKDFKHYDNEDDLLLG
mgnify:CR=1 FL=1